MTVSSVSSSRLLAIDDNLDSAELITRIAVKSGYDARSMTDLRTLTDVLQEWMPDVLTLDLCMPQEDGIGILSQLKACGFSGALLIVSGQDDWLRKTAGRLATARGLNVAGDLSKPVDLKILREILANLRVASSGAVGTNTAAPTTLT